MSNIDCPLCGPRSETEFECRDEADIERPGPYAQVSDRQWAKYLYYRDNTEGIAYERWRHRFGCGQWFNVARNTRTHRILAVYAIGDKRPAPEAEES